MESASSSSPLGALFCALFPSCDSEIPRVLLRDLAAREFNAFLWISLIAITSLLIAKVFKLLRLWRRGNRIPGPPCPSFYGHRNLISRETLTGQLHFFHSLCCLVAEKILKTRANSYCLLGFLACGILLLRLLFGC